MNEQKHIIGYHAAVMSVIIIASTKVLFIVYIGRQHMTKTFMQA